MQRHTVACLLAGFVTCAIALGSQAQPADRSPLCIHVDFPGGSAVVEELDQQSRTIRIVPTPHDDRGWVCWWYFKLTGIKPGETITLDVGEGVWATPDRAAYSVDGVKWTQTSAGTRKGKRIVYQQKVDAEAAWFAWGPPFVPADAQTLVERTAKDSSHASAFELCTTREGRSVPALRISQAGVADEERFGVWIQARQHAWESGSSWVGRGFVSWLVSNDARAETLRKKALVTVVPIMDIDNVAIGAGGKEQKPQDHNRDWSDTPHWKSVAAAQGEIAKLNEHGRFDLFIDLHNPGPTDRNPYFYVTPKDLLSEPGRRNLEAFVKSSAEEIAGPLKLSEVVRESGASYDKNWERISKNWVTRHTRDHVVAVTLETAWNTPDSVTENYERVGRELGLAIERYFRTAVRRKAP